MASLELFGVEMYLKLRACKCIYKKKTCVRFAVINPGKSDKYPENFVCLLPEVRGLKNPRSTFFRLFGDRDFEVAKSFLSDALRETSDSEVKAEIERRLRDLSIKRM